MIFANNRLELTMVYIKQTIEIVRKFSTTIKIRIRKKNEFSYKIK